MGYERNSSGLPPDRMPREKTLGHCSRLFILGSEWELLVMSKDDKARPFPVSSEVLDLETTSGFCRIHSIFCPSVA